ncbi:MAG TPA: DUF4412 domain-containing protein [Ignavibacteriaceae bacterium]|jgi:hypothetical protein|nr:DUF4412 domain-containing protein [Ignavibacteriaceae bacterium]
MKNFIALLSLSFLLITLFPVNSLAQKDFEGELTMIITAEESNELVMKVKGKLAKLVSETEEGTVDIIFDNEGKKMVTVIHQQQMYMEFQFDSMDDMEDEESTEEADVDIKKTGNKKTINGYDCYEYIVKEEGQEVEMWVADTDIPFLFFQDFGMMGDESGNKNFGKYKDLMKGFPMLIIIKDESGNVESKVEIASIKKTPVSAKEFEIPQNYQKINMPMMNMDKNH